jgi:transcriptional regulator with XRE-family HTH domain
MALEMRNMKAADLCQKTGIPKGAISYYLSGKSEPKADRLYIICKALDVAEAWLLGYDVAVEKKPKQKKNDAIADIVVRLQTDEDFLFAVNTLYNDSDKLKSFLNLIA